MIEVIGKEGITARVIADSINNGVRLTTFEIEFNRYILAELNTHKMLSKNSASSRAIPVNKLLDMIDNNPAMPVHWGKNQPGMSAREELTGSTLEAARLTWIAASKIMISFSRVLSAMGLHKQVVNRICESHQRMKTVISGTEWSNFFHLRDHEDAQPEFRELARVMRAAQDQSIPKSLKIGEWHLPYVKSARDVRSGELSYFTSVNDVPTVLSIEDALIVSASCCAQVSYRNLDDTMEKARFIYGKLIESDTPHMSPLEHQGKVMIDSYEEDREKWENGVTHMRRDGTYWSANFRGFIQARQLVKNEAVWY